MALSEGGQIADVHFFEPTGYGGVFQHTCRMAESLTRKGLFVVIHTSQQHESVVLRDVVLCECCSWPRSTDRSATHNISRRTRIATRLIARTMPHLLRTMRHRSILHIQGIAATGELNLLAMALARLAGHRVVYSPHDTFTRRRGVVGSIDNFFLHSAYRAAQAIVVYSQADRDRLEFFGFSVYLSPLTQLVPQPSSQQKLEWRREWRAGDLDKVILIAGFIRPERRLDLLIDSARQWPSDRRLAVVGPDWGDWTRCSALARSYGIDIAARVEFVELDQFAAAIAAADLVVVPTDVASQSGVLALARELGTPTIAANVGGLGELASRTFIAGDVNDLTRSIQQEFDEPSVVDPIASENEAVQVHLLAYRLSP